MLDSVKSIQGNREYMEDKYVYYEQENEKYGFAFICDGHGGDKTAIATTDKLSSLFIPLLDRIRTNTHIFNIDIAISIRNIITEWGYKISHFQSGSTLTGILFTPSTLFVFNIGDSRTVFKTHKGLTYVLLPIFNSNGEYMPQKIKVQHFITDLFQTIDHDHSSHDEIKRVQQSGGKISGERLNGVLSVTRALGDYGVGKGICYVPDIYWTPIENIASPISMYSDGVYEIQRYTKKNPDKDFSDSFLHSISTDFGAHALVDYSYQNGSDDNLTALVVKLSPI
jgi:serine/threonine protein phosphatase PrpC